jgi:RNA polymerase sigma-70 factor, ECF subfamily
VASEDTQHGPSRTGGAGEAPDAEGEWSLRQALADAFPAVRRYVFVLCGQWDQAEEVAAEAMLRAWRGRAGFDGRADARTWIFTIARNQWLDCLRQQRRRPRMQTMDESLQLTAPSTPPPTSAGRAELAEAVRSAMGRLPGEQAEALALRESRGLTFAQIAVLLGIPVATAKSRVRYALLKLAEELRPFGPEAKS